MLQFFLFFFFFSFFPFFFHLFGFAVFSVSKRFSDDRVEKVDRPSPVHLSECKASKGDAAIPLHTGTLMRRLRVNVLHPLRSSDHRAAEIRLSAVLNWGVKNRSK